MSNPKAGKVSIEQIEVSKDQNAYANWSCDDVKNVSGISGVATEILSVNPIILSENPIILRKHCFGPNVAAGDKVKNDQFLEDTEDTNLKSYQNAI